MKWNIIHEWDTCCTCVSHGFLHLWVLVLENVITCCHWGETLMSHHIEESHIDHCKFLYPGRLMWPLSGDSDSSAYRTWIHRSFIRHGKMNMCHMTYWESTMHIMYVSVESKNTYSCYVVRETHGNYECVSMWNMIVNMLRQRRNTYLLFWSISKGASKQTVRRAYCVRVTQSTSEYWRKYMTHLGRTCSPPWSSIQPF